MFLVVGSTGALGGLITRRLLRRGEEVRCLIRPGTDASELSSLGADAVPGDLTDPASLRPACLGVDVVIATATAISRRLSGAGGPSIREVDERGMAALVDTAQEMGVGQFVYLSYAGVDAGLGFPLERAKLVTEQRLRASHMRQTVIRPDAFQEIHLGRAGRFDMRAGKVAVFGTGEVKQRWVSADDVASLVTSLTVEPEPPSLIEFGGPEAISRNEAILLAERLTGRKMKRRAMPRAIARPGMRGLNRPFPALSSIIGLGLLQDATPGRWDDSPLRERGIEPRSATQFLTEQARLLTTS